MGEKTIECKTLHGEKKIVSIDSLIFRPTVYGIVIHEDKILLVNTKATNKLFFPGGAVEKGEMLEDALKREIHEEAGIEVTIKSLFKIHTNFFYYDPWDKAFHNISTIYLCEPKSIDVTDIHNEKKDEAEKPRWVKLRDVKSEDFQDWAGEVVEEFLLSQNKS